MKYSRLVEVYQALEKTSKKLEKRDALAELYKATPPDKLYKVTHLSLGWMPTGAAELGIAREMMLRIIEKTYGASPDEAVKKFKETGDLGLVAEYFDRHRKQKGLGKKELTIDLVFDNIMKLPEISGQGSQEKKIALVSELLSAASPEEARYIVRTVLGDMRVGVAHGTVRDAIAAAFGQDPKVVEQAWNYTNDFGKVAEMARAGKIKAEVELFRPIKVQLAEPSPSLEEAFGSFENVAVEWKLDGFRAEIHKVGDKVKIFSRRLEDVTNQFPEVTKWAKENVKVKECIIEGEILAVDAKTRSPRPFQQLSRRIQRKHDIEKMVEEIPVRIDLFELTWLNGEIWMAKPFSERWRELKKIVHEARGKFQLVEHLETKDLAEAERFYKDALAKGMEGVIVKNLDAHYDPGKRVGFWLKVKPIMEPLDLVVVGAEWGEGKRAKWLSSYVLAARDPKSGKFLESGRMASGMTEEQLEEMTKRLKKLIVEEHGKIVKVKPDVVIEVGYEEIQKSTKYDTGYAFRFPRLLRIRDDKSPKDANTVADIERLFKQQKRRK
jgi:DNA ligase-1